MKTNAYISRVFSLVITLLSIFGYEYVFALSQNKIEPSSQYLVSAVADNVITSPSPFGSCNGGFTVGIIYGTDITGATYEWFRSTDFGTIWSANPIGVEKDFDPGFLTRTTWYKRTAIVNGATVESNIVKIAIANSATLSNNKITINGSQNGTVAEGEAPIYPIKGAVLGGGDNKTYEYYWQHSDDGSNWKDIKDADGADYQPGALYKETRYRRFARFWECTWYQCTDYVTIRVAEPKITRNQIIQPVGSNGICGEACLTVEPINGLAAIVEGSDVSISYEWIQSDDIGLVWKVAQGDQLQGGQNFQPRTVCETSSYKRIAIAGSLRDSSISVNLVVTPEGLTNNVIVNGPTTVNKGDSGTLEGSVVLPSKAGVSYKWQVYANLTWVTVDGYDYSLMNKDFMFTSLQETTTYRRLAKAIDCPEIISQEWKVVVEELGAIGDNKITAPAETSFCGATVPSLIVGSDASNVVRYQWEQNTSAVGSDSGAFTTIIGATGKDFQPDVISSNICFRRVAFSQDDTNIASNIVCFEATLDEIIGNSILSDDSFEDPNDAKEFTIIGSITIGGNGVFNFLWEQSDSCDGAWKPASGINNEKNYFVGVITKDTYFRRVVTSGTCKSITECFFVPTVPYVNVGIEFSKCVRYKGNDDQLEGSAEVTFNVKNNSTLNVSGLKVELDVADESYGEFLYFYDNRWIPSFENEFKHLKLTYAAVETVAPDVTVPIVVYFLPNSGVKDFELLGEVSIDQVQDRTDNNRVVAKINNFVSLSKVTMIPNLISPNGDGKNDYFVIQGIEGYVERELTIFDRWGTKVYYSKSYDNSWDAAGLADGTFYYILKLSENGESPKINKGFITVLRSPIKD